MLASFPHFQAFVPVYDTEFIGQWLANITKNALSTGSGLTRPGCT